MKEIMKSNFLKKLLFCFFVVPTIICSKFDAEKCRQAFQEASDNQTEIADPEFYQVMQDFHDTLLRLLRSTTNACPEKSLPVIRKALVDAIHEERNYVLTALLTHYLNIAVYKELFTELGGTFDENIFNKNGIDQKILTDMKAELIKRTAEIKQKLKE